jgi:hypothetical protein
MSSGNGNLIIGTKINIFFVACIPTFPSAILTVPLPYYFISSLIDLSHILPIFFASIPKSFACLQCPYLFTLLHIALQSILGKKRLMF